jgi:hypothetical protein
MRYQIRIRCVFLTRVSPRPSPRYILLERRGSISSKRGDSARRFMITIFLKLVEEISVVWKCYEKECCGGSQVQTSAADAMTEECWKALARSVRVYTILKEKERHQRLSSDLSNDPEGAWVPSIDQINGRYDNAKQNLSSPVVSCPGHSLDWRSS